MNVFTVLILLGGGVSLVQRFVVPALRRRMSGSWPWAPSRIESGSVERVTRGRAQVYELTVRYSYSVDGQEYGGTYAESFARESEAQSLLQSLRELPPPARYKPGNPSRSAMDPYRDAALAVTSHP